MSEYREHWNLTADPPTAAVYARMADAHDRSAWDREARNRVRRTVEPGRRGVRPGMARALRRLAAAIEPAPATCGSETA
ncbi:hypothetical protein [Tsukamurella ocularis]|uniref:hypothetical protein n=1 Tax=Tsukamurella ocularis TaxID=1970234 RepID=UPI002169E4FF|nr:hypothetical protein [Tsukamurella ocularis]MCS3778360.1 hypothetical protein [Tsukamurella ocularis]MCS3789061.1 hypothetical protein [Tsukamurella ocularis]MCS3852912.1 hypothetical protein [Tsukamurella ocularis]